MIYGIGTDLVSIARICELYEKFPNRFPKRLLSHAEYAVFLKRQNKIPFLAKRFAAKEAFLKALGTGLRQLRFSEISILNDALGKPVIEVAERIKAYFPSIDFQGSHISLSDERAHALAFIILMKIEKK